MLNILYTCDDAFIPMTSVSIASVIENNKEAEICFYIATEKENSANFRRVCDFYSDNKKINFVYLDCRQYDRYLEQNDLDRWGSESYYVYWKLFAYDLIDADYVWYLDSDEICLNPIEYPDIGKAVGAVLDSAHADFNKIAHIDTDYYLFNTGSLFVDINKWKSEKCTELILDYLKNMKFKPLMCDQDILASALQDHIEVIDPKYNYLAGYDYYGVYNSFKMYSLDRKPFYKQKDIIQARDHVIFYHCLNGVFGRPWEKGNSSPVKEEYNLYRKMSVWPDFEKGQSSSLLFSIEKAMEILPDGLYNRIHNTAQKIYLRLISHNN